MPRNRQLAGMAVSAVGDGAHAPLPRAVWVMASKFGLLARQAGQVELVAEFAAQHLLLEHVRIVENRMDDRNLA
jgi:hypothetical protein